MSTLTKILVVLIALSSIFLCGITVTYVGSATDYKKAYDERRDDIQSLKSDKVGLEEQIDNLTKQLDAATTTLSNRTEELQTENDVIKNQLKQVETELSVSRDTLEKNSIILADNAKTVEMNNSLTKQAKEEAAKLLDEQRANTTKINQLQDEVVTLNATIAQLEKDNKRLIEEKTKIQNDLDRSLMAAGKRTGIPSTSEFQTAPAIRDLDLEGVIMEVKPEESLASISIGSAHGVKNNMRFHVIRNNAFVCDIVVSKVDADQASGHLDLVTNGMPKAGDKVKTNL